MKDYILEAIKKYLINKFIYQVIFRLKGKLEKPIENRLMFDEFVKLNKKDHIHKHATEENGLDPFLLTIMPINKESVQEIVIYLAKEKVEYFGSVEFSDKNSPHFHLTLYLTHEKKVEVLDFLKKFNKTHKKDVNLKSIGGGYSYSVKDLSMKINKFVKMRDINPFFKKVERTEEEARKDNIEMTKKIRKRNPFFIEKKKYSLSTFVFDSEKAENFFIGRLLSAEELEDTEEFQQYINCEAFQEYIKKKALLKYFDFRKEFYSSTTPSVDVEREVIKLEKYKEKNKKFLERDGEKHSLQVENYSKEQLKKLTSFLSRNKISYNSYVSDKIYLEIILPEKEQTEICSTELLKIENRFPEIEITDGTGTIFEKIDKHIVELESGEVELMKNYFIHKEKLFYSDFKRTFVSSRK
jgi:hypothetical protein